MHVNNCLHGFDQFGPHPTIARDKLSSLVSFAKNPATLSPNPEHSLSIALTDSTDRHDQQLYLLDVSRFLIS